MLRRFVGVLGVSFVFLAVFAAPVCAIEVAEELFVNLDADDPTAGEAVWENKGSLADFAKIGNPIQTEILGVQCVLFNERGTAGDAYQCQEFAPPGLVDLDPTRSIEAWVYNESIVDEETIVAWGKRGGPVGSNMSFNYGANIYYGAVGHWGWDGPDLGWGSVPAAGEWHHLVYTYDGTTTRVYADGVLANMEELGSGVILTHSGTPITLAAQLEPNGVDLNIPLGGTLAIARLRIHDGVLTPKQILANYNEERKDFPVSNPIAPGFVDAPAADTYSGGDPTYIRIVNMEGMPFPTAELLEPAGAKIQQLGLRIEVTYEIPRPEPDSFRVRLKATNVVGSAEVSWVVSRKGLPPPGVIAVAEELFVDLDAQDPSAGTQLWENKGSLSEFERVGSPFVVADVNGVIGVEFNSGASMDAYRCLDEAPAGLIGPDATRSIEAWVYNPTILAEETIVAWGRRGGPCGTNMSFNYGTDQYYGAVGHWCHLPGPDIGWGTVPSAGEWHHLAYTYDGTTTRVYVDGEETNSEFLGAGAINTHCCTRICIAAQYEADGQTLNVPLRGRLTIGRLRIHDGTLKPGEVRHNYEAEKDIFIPQMPPEFLNAPAEDSFTPVVSDYTRTVHVRGNPKPSIEILEPAGATITPAGLFTYRVPVPPPASFTVRIRATNVHGVATASWVVTVVQAKKLRALPVHRYSFTQDASDSIGGADGVPYGNVTFEGGSAVLGNTAAENSNANGQSPPAGPPGAYIDLPNGIISALGKNATFETWVTWRGPTTAVWQRIFDFGTSAGGENWSNGGPNQYNIFLTPASGANTLRFGYRSGATSVERVIDDTRMALRRQQHVAVVWEGDQTTVSMYVNGRKVAEDTALHFALDQMPDVNNWLGRSQWADPMFAGSYNEFRIYNYPLNASEVLGNFNFGPDVLEVEGPGRTQFRRGDSNADGSINITDGIFTLNFLFLGGGEPPCMEAADANDDGSLNITDGIYVLNFLFLGGPDPVAPGPEKCGPDRDGSPDLGCASYPKC